MENDHKIEPLSLFSESYPQIPQEVFERITHFLGVRDLAAVSRVNRFWNKGSQRRKNFITRLYNYAPTMVNIHGKDKAKNIDMLLAAIEMIATFYNVPDKHVLEFFILINHLVLSNALPLEPAELFCFFESLALFKHFTPQMSFAQACTTLQLIYSEGNPFILTLFIKTVGPILTDIEQLLIYCKNDWVHLLFLLQLQLGKHNSAQGEDNPINDMKKNIQRLNETFASQTQELLDACTHLFPKLDEARDKICQSNQSIETTIEVLILKSIYKRLRSHHVKNADQAIEGILSRQAKEYPVFLEYARLISQIKTMSENFCVCGYRFFINILKPLNLHENDNLGILKNFLANQAEELLLWLGQLAEPSTVISIYADTNLNLQEYMTVIFNAYLKTKRLHAAPSVQEFENTLAQQHLELKEQLSVSKMF